MLVTLAFAACGITIWFYASKKRRSHKLNIDRTVLVRNLRFFILSYSIGISAALVPGLGQLRWLIALCLVLTYPLFVFRSLTQQGELSSMPEKLHFAKLLSHESSHLAMVTLQIVVGIVGIICGAYFFVDHLESIAGIFHVSPLLMSLIITPIATELPEQATSIMWARRGKDTLALGNISGSLVFQSCFPVAFGVGCTSWQLDPQVTATSIVSLCLAAIYLFSAKRKILEPAHLICGSLIYAATMIAVVYSYLPH